MGISDDIKPKKSRQDLSDKNSADEISDPDEIAIRHEKPPIENPYQRDPDLAQREDDFFDSGVDQDNFYEKKEAIKPLEQAKEKKTGNPMTKWVVMLIIILIALLGWQNYTKIIDATGLKDILGLSTTNQTDTDSVDTYEQATDYTGQAGTATDSTGSTGDQAQDSTTATETAPDKSAITIEILNGNGISGSARSVKDLLVQAGFTVDKVTNAYNFNYQSTIVYYKTGKITEANLVKDALTSRKCSTDNDDTVVGNYDIVVVVGKT